MNEELLRIGEVARRYNLGRSTVYLMAQRGDIPTVRIGKAVRVPAKALDDWLRRQVRQPNR